MRRWLMKTLIDLLQQAVEHPEERAEIMFVFQRMVRHGRGEVHPSEEWLWDIFLRLVNALSLYESVDEHSWKVSVSLTDERREWLIREALAQIEETKQRLELGF